MDHNWTTLSSSPYKAAVQTIGYKGKKHQDWCKDNSDTIKSLLENIHRSHSNPKQPYIQVNQAAVADSSKGSSDHVDPEK